MTWQIPFTEYMLPNGRRKINHYITEDEEVFSKALQLIGANYSFTVELLRTGEVSVCIVDNQEEEDVVIKVARNNAELVATVDAMILGFHIGSNRNDSTPT